jgi:hypothetical protein
MHISSKPQNRYQTPIEDMISSFTENEKLRKTGNNVVSNDMKKSQDFFRMMTDPAVLENDSSVHKDLTALAPKGRLGLKIKALELQTDATQNIDNVKQFHNNKNQDVFEGASSRSQWQRFCG